MLLNVLPQYKLEEKQDCLSQTHTVGELIYICKINLYILPGCNLKNWQCIAVDYQVWMWKNVKVDWTWKKCQVGSFYRYRLIPHLPCLGDINSWELIYACKMIQQLVIFSRFSQPVHFSRFKPDNFLLSTARFSGYNLEKCTGWLNLERNPRLDHFTGID